ncbi:MAG: HD domain-containing protein [Anaerolineae bacterium]|nr:HD domain-containing protein [Anaerolineae bacterium]
MLTARFGEALAYAHQLHAGQARKASGTPYIAHLLSAAALVLEDGGDEDEAIAALLHDAVEDQGGRVVGEAIRARFGDRVAEIVYACSDAETLPKPPWRERKEQFIARLATAAPEVVRVTAADKLHNVRCLTRDCRVQGEAVWTHFRGGKEGTLWYSRAVYEALRRRGNSPLIEAFGIAVETLEELAGVC